MAGSMVKTLFDRIDSLLQKGSVILAIDGGSGSGQTTLAGELAEKYGCRVFHMDDFFLRPEQRTAARFAEVGGNVDRERFLSEVLTPLSKVATVVYRPFDCSRMALGEEIRVEPTALTVVEGAYSMHPTLAGFYDLSVFLDISPDLQRERILARNTEKGANLFFERWIPLEERYFAETDIKGRCDMVFHLQKEPK